ncbi:DeoR family transcriptional regulator [Amycolatopsis antarctica]|uniref:Lactose phosphotransferase system repressor n=1 Tax=Amycolatopsis antarctica TaxID=1854586 RepID=A0A263CWX3_9PSEU|nr:DeoR/GlpR family DNA-binding transcription regulator [Amycolatopsis antarctica]OZM70458.1 DeoR family transcriptional regulator [Amycolatopsis antarctica]
MVRPRLSDAEVERRRQEILRHVIDAGEVRIGALGERFGVSLMTIHRDLDDLAARRLLRKLRGKVAAYPALTLETATRFREGLRRDCKRALAAAAVAHVREGQTLLLDDSTTLFPLAAALTGFERLTVVTNSLRIARLLAEAPGVGVRLLGGSYKGDFDSCFGPEVVSALAEVWADTAFVSATAIAHGRMYHPVEQYAELKAALLCAAGRRIVLADHSKFGRTATYDHGGTADVDLVVTDRAAPAAELAAIRRLGTGIEIVDGCAGTAVSTVTGAPHAGAVSVVDESGSGA